MEKDDGGQAFSLHIDAAEGMTLQDYFAAHAMRLAMEEYRLCTSTVKQPMAGDWRMEYGLAEVATAAYDMADAMLEERKARKL